MISTVRIASIVSLIGGIVGWSVDSQTQVRIAVTGGVAFIVAVHALVEAAMHHDTQRAGADVAKAKIAAQNTAQAVESSGVLDVMEKMERAGASWLSGTLAPHVAEPAPTPAYHGIPIPEPAPLPPVHGRHDED